MRARDHADDAHRVRRESEQSDRHVVAADALEAFIASVPEDTLVVLDEAYNEYLPPEQHAPSAAWVASHPNLIVSRTFSKAYGLAALRVGYGIMHAKVADMLNRVRQPFNVNALAQAAALAALADTAYVDESRAFNRAGHAAAGGGPARAGLSFVPSHANFLLVRSAMRRSLPAPAGAGCHRAPGRQLRAAGVPARHDRAARGKPPFSRRVTAALAG